MTKERKESGEGGKREEGRKESRGEKQKERKKGMEGGEVKSSLGLCLGKVLVLTFLPKAFKFLISLFYNFLNHVLSFISSSGPPPSHLAHILRRIGLKYNLLAAANLSLMGSCSLFQLNSH